MEGSHSIYLGSVKRPIFIEERRRAIVPQLVWVDLELKSLPRWKAQQRKVGGVSSSKDLMFVGSEGPLWLQWLVSADSEVLECALPVG